MTNPTTDTLGTTVDPKVRAAATPTNFNILGALANWIFGEMHI